MIERDAELAAALVAWFDRVARDLPWRRTRDPYAIWLSEVMLQQTRVETVIPYYERFLARYPTVDDLAAAPLDDVLSLWSGLGYYRRARVLHLAAREVSARHGGALPRDVEGLRALPGVGAYTAGAVASIAFDQAVPLVDGNVARVLSRLDGIDDDIRTAAGTRKLWAAAERLVRAAKVQPGRFNQALMELGATVCTPRNPRCDACPVDGACSARALGRQGELPVIAPKRDVPTVSMVAAVVRSGERVLFVRRAEDALFGGLWEPPMVEAPTLARARVLLAEAGVDPDASLREVGRVRHILTHRRLEVRVARAEVAAQGRLRAKLAAPYEKAAWLDPSVLDIGVSKLARKVLSAAAKANAAAAARAR
jgi:A/G-specific adenine glycosylase